MRRGRDAVVLGALALASSACGARTDLRVDRDAAIPGMDAATPIDAGADAGTDGGTDGGFDASFDAGPSCLPFRGRATLAELDVFVLLDTSGSMQESTSAGVQKARAVAAALSDFVRAPESAGVGVALTFFPFFDESVPEHCVRDAQCGESGSCDFLSACYPSGDEWCRTDGDCSSPADRCVPVGYCSGRTTQLCLPGISAGCSEGSRCVDEGFCLNHTSCRAEDYAPVVPLATLPGAADAFVAALDTRIPEGETPTAPAIDGTLREARARRVESPGSKVIVLLATDGVPTLCDPAIPRVGPPMLEAGIPLVASIVGEGAANGVQTFVVGVFRPEDEDEARANLSAIARAGGTDEALIVTTTEPVTDRLLAILDDLRRTVRTCVYAIPHAGVLPDPELLQVRLVPRDGEPTELSRVAGPEACDPVAGGFFFEPDLAMGARPGYAELCPASCAVAARSGVTVEMQGDCSP